MNPEEREKHKLYMRSYMAANPGQQEKARQRARAYYWKNRSKILRERRTPEYRERMNRLNRQRYAENKEPSVREQLKRYGLTLEDFERIVSDQGGGCYFCGRQETAQHEKRTPVTRLSVDHDHETGRVRGIVCLGCNISLGYAERGHISRHYRDPEKLSKYLGRTVTIDIRPKGEFHSKVTDDWLEGMSEDDVAMKHGIKRQKVYEILGKSINVSISASF